MTIYFLKTALGFFCLATTVLHATATCVSQPPVVCNDVSIDTITRTKEGSTYVFRGEFYWKVDHNVSANGYPKRISDDWGGLEGSLDASFTLRDGTTYFFKDSRYWKFTNREMHAGYPDLISKGFKGIPDHVNAAICWSGNGSPYFFKGDKYYRYDWGEDPPVIWTYPAPITNWKGLPVEGVDAAFVWDNGVSYFFKGGRYYRWNDSAAEVSKDGTYPIPAAYAWFSCVLPISGDSTTGISKPDICQDASIDAITKTIDGSTYAFKGDWYWKIDYNHSESDYPRPIAWDWEGLSGFLDAAFTMEDGNMYFFKGTQYWRFRKIEEDGKEIMKRQDGYPRKISEGFPGIPDNVDAVIEWNENRKVYFFKGNQYWKFDYDGHPRVTDSYPASISYWEGLPGDGVDAAFVWNNNFTYFFKCDSYYRFDDATSKVSTYRNYPASTAYRWFNCPVARR